MVKPDLESASLMDPCTLPSPCPGAIYWTTCVSKCASHQRCARCASMFRVLRRGGAHKLQGVLQVTPCKAPAASHLNQCWLPRYTKDLASGHQKAMDKLLHEQAQVDEYLAQRKLDEVGSLILMPMRPLRSS